MAKTTKRKIAWGQGKYPWDKWADGQQWQVVQGEDFHTDVEGFRNALSSAASRRKMKVRGCIDPEDRYRKTYLFQFYTG